MIPTPHTHAAPTALRTGNRDDLEYERYRESLQLRVMALALPGIPLFCTDARLWDTYLAHFPESQRQFHNCSACRHFINRYGGLVTIDECTGETCPLMWHPRDAPPLYQASVEEMGARVRRAKVTGVFLTRRREWGTHETGIWTHLAVYAPVEHVYSGKVSTPGQAMAEKRQDYGNLGRALEEFSPRVVDQAVDLLSTDALYRSEKVEGPAKWLQSLHRALQGKRGPWRANVLWHFVATAPAGFCHPRSSIIGTLLEDLSSGMRFEDVARRFKAKMHPLQYQRPQALPSQGNIAQAEKVVAQLGIAKSLERRFARLDEVQTTWRPPQARPPEGSEGGVFGHLRSKEQSDAAGYDLKLSAAQRVTWEKFARTVLPNATQISVYLGGVGDFVGLTTAQHFDAPPILQWDRPEQRNPVAWYRYASRWSSGSDPARWGLRPYAPTRVTAICLQPSLWFGRDERQGKDAFLILEGAVDSSPTAAMIFPETLKSEFHSIRATIEAYSKAGTLGGAEQASACGLAVRGAALRVTLQAGTVASYTIDRWD